MGLKPSQCIASIASLGLSLGLIACSSEQPTKPILSSEFIDDNPTANEQIDRLKAPSGGGQRASVVGNSAKSTSNDEAEEDDVDETSNLDKRASAPPKEDGPSEIEALIKACGFADGNLPDPKKILFRKSMRSQQITLKGSKPIDRS